MPFVPQMSGTISGAEPTDPLREETCMRLRRVVITTLTVVAVLVNLRLRRVVITTLTVVAVLVTALLALALATELPAYAQIDDAPTCSTGTAVPDISDNPGLVSDCEALLASRDALAGTATLNWSADVPIEEWDGITVEETPQRVTKLVLDERLLTGNIPAELGGLSELRVLVLNGNELTGEIPAELGSLANLEVLELFKNRLTGSIPSWLGSLSNLKRLWIGHNQLSGTIPPELSSLSRLEELELAYSQLTGPIPSWLGSLSNLRALWLFHNQLTGPIPPELGSLTKMESLVPQQQPADREHTDGTGRPRQSVGV